MISSAEDSETSDADGSEYIGAEDNGVVGMDSNEECTTEKLKLVLQTTV